MKVAFYTYPSAFQNVGGGEILLLKVKQYVEKQGVQAEFFDIWKGRIEDYDILHVFGSVKDCLGLVRVANARKVKVVTTPLWWSDFRRAFFTEGSFLTKGDLCFRHATKLLFPAFPSARRSLLMASDLVFPNSQMEKEQIARHFAVPMKKQRIVFNGVDPAFSRPDPELFRKKIGQEPFILGVGRIEPRKNQLNLIRAVKRLEGGQRLVLIGSPVSGFEAYYQKCLEEGKGLTTFFPTLPHEDPLLKSAYAACSLFVLQGWFETPGLVALEAALAGARLIVTSGGSTRDYFGKYVEYLNPADPKDIAEKARCQLSRPPSAQLEQHVRDRFTWDKVAESYRKYYAEVLS